MRRVCHVLIIEDEPMVAMDLEAFLEEEGAISFSFAASQNEAVREALARKPDFITSDVALVEGTGPLAVAIILAAIGPIPVIFITGRGHRNGCYLNCARRERIKNTGSRVLLLRVIAEAKGVAGGTAAAGMAQILSVERNRRRALA